jgi:hypothetical protein
MTPLDFLMNKEALTLAEVQSQPYGGQYGQYGQNQNQPQYGPVMNNINWGRNSLLTGLGGAATLGGLGYAASEGFLGSGAKGLMGSRGGLRNAAIGAGIGALAGVPLGAFGSLLMHPIQSY